ncbi:MAG: hemerythrin domain-containing protein [Planctomycetes bacterium]|nr:hemerythrin domain-containing protein [Planctomycetota bacterium]
MISVKARLCARIESVSSLSPPQGNLENHMRPTEMLSADHRVIEQVLECLEKLAHAASSGRGLDLERGNTVLEFLSMFADRLHHGKEEGLLFPMLQARGMAENVGPIAVMLNEHDLGRSELARLRKALAAVDPAGFASAASAYVELLRDHIAKEDGVLFQMAEDRFSDVDRQCLVAEFDRADRNQLGSGVRDRLVESANSLAGSLGVPFGASRSQAPRSRSCSLWPCP